MSYRASREKTPTITILSVATAGSNKAAEGEGKTEQTELLRGR